MKNYAVIQNDSVVNVIVAKTLKDAELASKSECVECDGSFWIGWTRVDGVWTAPVVIDDSETL